MGASAEYLTVSQLVNNMAKDFGITDRKKIRLAIEKVLEYRRNPKNMTHWQSDLEEIKIVQDIFAK